MKQRSFSVPAMPEMEFAITKVELDSRSLLNHNEAHIHESCEVYINLTGDVSFDVENRLYPVSRGSVIITRPFEYHHCIYHSNAPHLHYWITFSAQKDQSFLEPFFNREKGMDNRIVLDESGLKKICGVVDALMDEQISGLDRRIKILEFFRILTECAPTGQADELEKLPGDVSEALKYIDCHLCEDVDVDTLAKACHVSINTLERHFKESLGDSPVVSIRKKRLIAAMVYLRNGESVTAAAQKSGFSDYSNFIQLFRRQFGITPGKYKRMLNDHK